MTPEYQYQIYDLECGHSQRIKKQHYKLGKFKCRECKTIKFKTEAEENGLDFISDTDSSYKRYKFKSCGHEKRALPEQVRTGSISCKECVIVSMDESLKLAGVTLLWKAKEKVSLLYNNCGHTIITKYSHILRNTIPNCDGCRLELIQEQAISQGLKLISKDTSNLNNNSYFYELPCGCTRSLRVGNVKRGVWACNLHSNWWSKPSNIYLIQFSVDNHIWLKLGVTTNIDRRILDYKLKSSFESNVIFCKQLSSYAEAVKIEKQLHSEFKCHNLDHNLMKEYMTNGFTECYSEKIVDSLIEELQKRVNND